MNTKIEFKGGQAPSKETEGSAGYDLYVRKTTIVQHGRQVIKAGFGLELPKGTCVLVFARSGVAAKGVEGHDPDTDTTRRYDCDVQLGLCDSDYRGEYGIIVNNHDKPFVLKAGASIAQALFLNALAPIFTIVDKLDMDNTERGNEGFKS